MIKKFQFIGYGSFSLNTKTIKEKQKSQKKNDENNENVFKGFNI